MKLDTSSAEVQPADFCDRDSKGLKLTVGHIHVECCVEEGRVLAEEICVDALLRFAE